MYQWMRRNNRKMLAIFSVFLMIVFILPSQMKNPSLAQSVVKMPDNSIRPYADVPEDLKEACRAAVASGISVMHSAMQATTDVIKISEPIRNQELAKNLQQLRLQLVEFSTAEYLDKV